MMEWFAADLGATLRLWHMTGTDVRGRQDLPAPATPDALVAALPEGTVVSGAAGMWNLWQPVPHAVPAAVRRDGLVLLPGLTQDRPLPDAFAQTAHVAGLLAAHSQFDGTLVVTGRRTTWLSISAGEVTDMRSTVTGQLLTTLARAEAIDTETFLQALPATLSRPETLAAHLARPDGDPSHLAAALVGAELAATKPWWLGRSVLVTGDGLGTLLVPALAAQGVDARALPEEAALLAGLRASSISP